MLRHLFRTLSFGFGAVVLFLLLNLLFPEQFWAYPSVWEAMPLILLTVGGSGCLFGLCTYNS